MKYMKQIVFICIIMSGLLMSCFDDQSNKDIHVVKPIAMDSTGIGAKQVVAQFEKLQMAPLIYKEGVQDADLSFLWEIKRQKASRELGKEMILNAEITEEPGSDYTILLTVTDNTTSLQAFFTWALTVDKTLGEGLLVADTKDEQTTDLNLIMAYNFTSSKLNDKNDVTMHNLYSKANGENIQGLVKSMSYVNYASLKNRSITCLTEDAILRVDPFNCKLMDRDEEVFVLAPEVIAPLAVKTGSRGGTEYLINNGKVHRRNVSGFSDNRTFRMAYLGDYYCSPHFFLDQYGWKTYSGLVYDEMKGHNRFLQIPGGYYNSYMVAFQPYAGGKFDPSNVGDKTCLYIGEGEDYSFYAVLRDRKGTDCYLYHLKNEEDRGALGDGYYELKNCNDIARAKFFTASPNEEVLYYATEERVYSALFGQDKPEPMTANDYLLVETGEKITSLRLHSGGGRVYLPAYNPTPENPYRWTWSESRILVVTTYNELTKEGKVKVIPIETPGTGILSEECIKVYDGFGRIVSVAIQGV